MRDLIVGKALGWVDRPFNPGQSAQCAAWVSAVLLSAGFSSPRWRPSTWVPDYSGVDNGQPMGDLVGMKDLEAGDVVIFGHTYLDATSTHIGLYVGEGWFVHRPTADRNVEKAWLLSGYWRDHFEIGVRLLPTSSVAPGRPVGNDGRGNAGQELRRARLEAHSGRASLRMDGQVQQFEQFQADLKVLGDGAMSVELAGPGLKFFQHAGGQTLLIAGKAVDLVDVDLELHAVPGKPPAIKLDIVFR
ncbi:MAG: hypothetical protein AMXMBFR33_01320 [Candidatus Xenobia bacterium]